MKSYSISGENILPFLAALLVTAATGDKCTDEDKGYFLELWKTEGRVDGVTDSMFEGTPFRTATSSSLSFNYNRDMVWSPFKSNWPDEMEFDNFVLRASARICTCEDVGLLLYMSSDDGSVLYLDREEHPEPLISMNQSQSVTDELSAQTVDFEKGVCKTLEIHYFEVEVDQFLNLEYWQVQPKPDKEDVQRVPLVDYVYLPLSQSNCEFSSCDNKLSEPDDTDAEEEKYSPSITTPVQDDEPAGNVQKQMRLLFIFVGSYAHAAC